MTNQVDLLENTPATTAWHTASNTLSGVCLVLTGSKLINDADADYRLPELMTLVQRLSTECDDATVKIIEEYDNVRAELDALKLSLEAATQL